MMTLRALSAVAAAFLLCSCTPPVSRVETVDDRPHLQFAHAPPDAVLLLDGRVAGLAAAFDGQNQTLTVDPGVHHVVVRIGDQVLYSQNVFLGEGTKTIDLPDHSQ